MNPFTKEPLEVPRFGRLDEREVDSVEPGVAFQPSAGTTRSHFLGQPLLEPGTPWPAGPSGPLDFLLCIDFAELPRGRALETGLPEDGVLNVFYDRTGLGWSLSPNGQEHWKLIYEASSVVEPKPPSGSLPGITFEAVAGPSGTSRHRLGGKPDWIQGDARPLLELTSGRYLRDPAIVRELQRAGIAPEALRVASYQSLLEIARALDAAEVDPALFDQGPAEWRLLMQIDWDARLDFHWGDLGTLYVMLPRASLAARQFDDAWMTVQCH